MIFLNSFHMLSKEEDILSLIESFEKHDTNSSIDLK